MCSVMLGLKHLGVIFFDSNNDNSVYQTAYSAVLFTIGIVHIVMYPSVSHKFDDWSKAFSMSLTAVTCSVGMITSLISRMIVIYNVRYSYQKFKTTLEGFEIYVPMNAVDSEHVARFSLVAIVLCFSSILPMNGLKLYYIFINHTDPVLMTIYFCFYYVHNLSMVCVELHFIVQCLVVYTKFRDVNEKLVRANDEQNRDYTARRLFAATASTGPKISPVESSSVIVYEKDFYCPKDKRYPLANTVELLRIEHWLTREAVHDLKCLFGVRMFLSIFFIGITSLFDVYTEVFYAYTNRLFERSVFRTKILFIGWMLQYSIRFCLIVVAAHTTIQQAVKTKKLITEMNNRHIDSNTKEELQLFYNQLSICSPEFTILDILTINNSLITSTLAAGATYILILVQFHSDRNTHNDHYLSKQT